MPAKLVAIGDSLTHGVQSGSISRTHRSYPAMLAYCLGEYPNLFQPDNNNDNIPFPVSDTFKVPDFTGEGGLPLNLENLFHLLAKRYGEKINWLEAIPAALTVRTFLDRTEDYWERGEGIEPSITGDLHHNLAVLSFQLADCDTLTESICRRHLPTPKDDFLTQIPELPIYRAARRTLNPSFNPDYENLSQIAAATKIAEKEGGIENLIFWLGANNCLGTVIDLEMRWSEDADVDRLSHERNCNLWRPEHFQKLLDRIAPKINAIGARDVFTATIPHVTIPPVSRGISLNKEQELSSDGYYEYYTHFWVWDDDFAKNPQKYPSLKREQAREIDKTIDAYNQIINNTAQKYGWHVVDITTQLDRLAFRRQKGKPQYEFPSELIAALKANPDTQNRFNSAGVPILDTRYLRLNLKETELEKRYQGGILSLDGIHPTTIAYGLIAHNFLDVMTKETDVQIVNSLPWDAIVREDSLVTNLPANLCSLRETIGFLYSQKMLLSLIQSFR
jgi:lysophospholipase L1-like esterase